MNRYRWYTLSIAASLGSLLAVQAFVPLPARAGFGNRVQRGVERGTARGAEKTVDKAFECVLEGCPRPEAADSEASEAADVPATGSGTTNSEPTGTQTQQSTQSHIVWTEKPVYAPGESITVYFAGFSASKTDWLTLVRASDEPNTYDGRRWAYTEGRQQGSLTFEGLEPGYYEVRSYYSWPSGGYKVRNAYGFRVLAEGPSQNEPSQQPQL